MWTIFFRTMMDRLIQTGSIKVLLPDGRRLSFGDGGTPSVTVKINHPVWIGRLVRDPELALGEAYMYRGLEVDGDDLQSLLALLLRNTGSGKSANDPISLWWRRLLPDPAERRGMERNDVARATANVRQHYDLRQQFYRLFLDKDLQYSCAYFAPGTLSLEQAQEAKKRHLARKLLLRPGLRVLDIGSGWGGLALTLARDHDVHVTGVTLSEEQLKSARARAQAMGLEDRVDFRLLDYRAVTGCFDRIVSVGMFEHVGVPDYGHFFGQVRDRLTEDGVALIHSIGRTSPPEATNPFIARHIFPGGHLPALSQITAAVEGTGLWTTDVECLRLHYAHTLNHWVQRYEASAAQVRMLYGDAFMRMWRFYLVASQQSFVHGRLAVFQVQLSKRIDAVPLTRDYLYPAGEGRQSEAQMAAE